MKIGKPSGKNVGDAVAQAGGLTAGILLSNGASEAIPLDNKMAKRGIVLVAGLAAVALVTGSDTGAKVVRSIGAGMAAQQAKELIKEAAAPHLPNVKFIKDSFEQPPLAPATADAMGRLAARRRKARGMASPDLFRMGTPATTEGFVMG